MDLFQLRLVLGVTLCFYSTAQMIERDQAILILKNIFDKLDIVLVKLEGQDKKLTSLEESQKTIRENMEGQNEKLASLEESQKTIRENMGGQNDKLASLEGMKEELKGDIQNMIKEAKNDCQAENEDTRTEVATLQHLLNTDECTDLSHSCSTEAWCTDTIVSFRCNCKPGFSGDGHNCTDVDECEETDRCDPQATCSNSLGSYSCTCNHGYKGDGITCEDINECDGEHQCDPQATCNNSLGNYTCSCNSGFRGDGNTCEDVDECSEDSHKCPMDAPCQNTIGNYTCTCTMHYDGDDFGCNDVQFQGCSEPFKLIRGVGCVHIIEDLQNWNTQREACKKLGGDLFVAEKADHYLKLAQHFININRRDGNQKYMYVGVKEGVWLNGRKVAPEEEAPQNPDMNGSERCSYTDGDIAEKFLLWTDPCKTKWWALCERNI